MRAYIKSRGVHRALFGALSAFAYQLAIACPAAAQAWLPPRGGGTVTITYQSTLARGELTTDGQLLGDEDTVRAHVLIPDVEWGLTDRIALNLTLPFVTARYRGDHPHLVNIRGEPKPIDDGTYHGGAQDFRFGLRYGLKTGPLAIAPFAEGIIPSHQYESLGHSVIGKDLRGFRTGVNVGGFLDAVAPGLYFHTQLSHTVVQEVLGIRPNRSGLDSEIGYFVTPRLAMRFLNSLLITHDGTDFPDPRLSVRIFFLNHDRLQKNKFANLAGGVSFALTDSLDGFAAVAGMVWGRNVHPHHGISVGMNWHFQAGGGQAVPTRNSHQGKGARRLPHGSTGRWSLN